MKEARIYVDLSEMIEENIVYLTKEDHIYDSKKKIIKLKEGLKVKLYSDDFISCSEKDNLIADGVVTRNSGVTVTQNSEWYCRLSSRGFYNESQE